MPGNAVRLVRYGMTEAGVNADAVTAGALGGVSRLPELIRRLNP
jgi:hypothetical protein